MKTANEGQADKISCLDMLGTVGNTPLLRIGYIYAKLETTNPTGSVKDRMACYMANKAEKRGELKPGSRILELTSGNTGIAFAMISAIRGYRFTAVMPDSMSIERIKMMKAFGAGIGTGGTLIGVAQALKKANPNVKIIGVEPAESAVLSGKKPGIHKIQGIGEGFVPKLVQDNMGMIDEFISVKRDDAIGMSRRLAKEHGILVGISSGANVLAAMQASKKCRNVVTVLPDRGERYMSGE